MHHDSRSTGTYCEQHSEAAIVASGFLRVRTVYESLLTFCTAIPKYSGHDSQSRALNYKLATHNVYSYIPSLKSTPIYVVLRDASVMFSWTSYSLLSTLFDGPGSSMRGVQALATSLQMPFHVPYALNLSYPKGGGVFAGHLSSCSPFVIK